MLSQKDSGDICLKIKEFDFYAQSVVDRKQLKKDTINLKAIVKSTTMILKIKNNRIAGDSVMLLTKDSISNIYRNAFISENSAKLKAEKKINIFKNLSLILGSTSIVLFGILLLVL